MPFIGQEPQAGSYTIIDSITTSATDTFNLTVDGVAFEPATARNLLVSVNGVTQAPETSFTVSGSQIVFSELLTESDKIDFILVLGNLLDIGTPSDDTVGFTQLKDGAVQSQKLANTISIPNLTVSNTFTQGAGDYIQNRYVLHGTTTDDTETEIFTINTNSRIPVPANTSIFYEASFAARRTDAANESGAWHIKGCADNFSGNTQDVGTVYEIAVAQDDVDLAVDIRADDTNDSIDVFVTGANNKTYSWTTVITTIEVHQ